MDANIICLYIDKNLLVLYAIFDMHLHLFAPLTTCVLLNNIKFKKELKVFSKFFALGKSKMTPLPSFIFRLLTQVFEVTNMGDSIFKLELFSIFGDFFS